ncbi:YqcI/YcgG family protein [Halococcus hamelinensis]|uniref:YqcI/YcgG family protein n=1 Tax=Halococcus hamelinensis 100A6 TaxID=1132509 RepID=M0M8T2_9EURY|nr:YqcI/YcgG family protein [Halococcus hamelinensis]EMA40825.1 hypothetical protein C447_03486 [Halococcus hamelinensis 100A6]
MSVSLPSRYLDQSTLRDRIDHDELPAWAAEQYGTFRKTMLDTDAPFPCYFGVESEATGMARYAFCASTTDEDALAGLRETLYEYAKTFDSPGERVSLVVFFAPPETPLTEAEYGDRLWEILQYLHDTDPEPWPYEIPADPDDPHWEFCFGGVPMFPTARAPFYEARRSRHNPHGLEITFQPRAIFEGITGDTAAGRRAREVIRERADEYDAVCPHADLGDWGDPDDREWKQYLLPEAEGESHRDCPLEITKP